MSSSYLQIASWNVEHLSGEPRKERRQSAFALTDHIEMAGVDIMALQEIYVTPYDEEVRLAPHQPVIESHAHGERRNSDLDVVCYLLEEHLKEPWRYHILPNRSSGDESQLCGLVWNTARADLTQITPLDVSHKVDGLNLWDRTPHAVNFTSALKVWRKDASGQWHQVEEQKTLSIVPIHMKSNYGGGTINRRVRAREAEVLCKALKD